LRDYPAIDYQRHANEFEALGVSENDLNVSTYWLFAEKKALSNTLLTNIQSVRSLSEKYSFNLPQMTRNVEDSLRHVHHTQREAGLALGISRWETVLHVVIPEALPSIVTGIVLASGRIFGEAAALIYTAGQSAPALDWSNWNIFSVTSPISIFRQAETLAVHIWKVNSEGTIPDGTAVSAGSAAVLLIFILIFNLGARKLGSYLHKKLTSA